jgi:multidrug resistance efflux pump
MTKRKLAAMSAIMCLVLIITSCGKSEETSQVEEVELSDESTVIEAFGTVKAERSKDVIIEFPAVVLDVPAKEGQHVGLNEPIITLDLTRYQAQIEDGKIELNIAKLEEKNAVASLQGLSPDDKTSEIEKLKNNLDFAKAHYEQAAEDFKNKENLFNEGAISQESYNQYKKITDEAKIKMNDIEYELKIAVESNDRIIEQYKVSKETEMNQTDILTQRSTQIEYNVAAMEYKLNKPFIAGNQIVSEYSNAAVYDIKYAPGNITSAEQKAFTIVNLDSLIVEANVPEEFIKDVKAGQTVKIIPVADRTKEYEGSVEDLSQMAFSINGETVIPVRIAINTTDSFLLPNYNVDVYIDVK